MKNKSRKHGNLSTVNFVCRIVFTVGLGLVAISSESAELDFQFQNQSVEKAVSLRGLSVVDQRTAWASGSGGTVLRTVDGENWEFVSVGGQSEADFRDIQAFDSETAVVLSAGSPALVFRTIDGGKSWQEVYRNDHPDVFFDAMAFWPSMDKADRRGIAFSDPMAATDANSPRAIDPLRRMPILRTVDSGESWILGEETVGPGPRAAMGEAGFAASGTCLTVGGEGKAWIGLGGKTPSGFARVLYSSDKGQTWASATTPINANESAGIFSVAFADLRNGIAVGGDYKQPENETGCVAITRDGGASWSEPPNRGMTGFRSCVAHTKISGNNVWVAVGTNGSDYSTDGGNTWRIIETRPRPGMKLSTPNSHAVAFAPGDPQAKQQTAWVVGPNGYVSKWTVRYGANQYALDDFSFVPKIDMHTHIHTDVLDFVSMARRDSMHFLSMAVHDDDNDRMEFLHRTTYLQLNAAPTRFAAVVSFPMKGWDEPDWQQKTIGYLNDAIAKGAIGVKVWKNIGMEFRNKDGDLVMIDHPKFDAVIDHIRQRDLVLIAHLGEPKNCWLPLEEMTTNNDRSYFSENPKYHMHLHPEMPSYEEQNAARDRMLAKHPNLNFVGAHLASLEWSVDEMADFLDRFPKATIGCAARLGQLQYQSQQDREKVIAFLTKYQDRVMYGTDLSVEQDDLAIDAYRKAKERWLSDWRYFNTDEMIKVYELDDPVQGLKLPKSIVDKIYWSNAKRVFARSWQGSAIARRTEKQE